MTWRPTVALLAAALAVLAALGLAVVLHRADLVVVAAPFAAWLAAAATPPAARVSLRPRALRLWEDESGTTRIAVEAPGADAVTVTLAHDPSLRLDETTVCVDGTAGVTVQASVWGRAVLRPTRLVGVSGHGLLRAADDGPFPATVVTVLPFRKGFRAGDAMPYATGLVGSHRSRALGSGHDLYAVREFVAGDRLRRIVWPVSLRTGSLHVMTTTEERGADVQLVLDSAIDVAGSLDTAVRAAASVAEHYLHRGDRVGFIDLGRPLRAAPFGSGRRQLYRVVEQLLDSKVRDADARASRMLRQIPPSALAIVFTTLLDAAVSAQITWLRRAGTSVVLLDTLPPGFDGGGDEVTATAFRIALLQRSMVRDALGDAGVPMVAWQGPGSLDAVLAQLARSVRMPRRAR